MSQKLYDPQTLEEKWLAFWEQEHLFQNTASADALDPLYLLIAFPYPSGSGLHVGHVESKTALDILARYYRMNGKDVFFPIGWDAFGLPAENFAIKSGIHPAETTKSAINTFRRQIKEVGISYDWTAEIATSHPGYYKWTQWIFLQLYQRGLAYQAEAPVNWCPSCQTVLANEQVVDGNCERCGNEVIQKEMKQWFFKITDYKEELISGLDQVDWPKATKEQQLNWIGKSTGATVAFKLVVDGKQLDEQLEVFTTAHDTLFGCTFMVVAPEHQLLESYTDSIGNWAEVAAYIEASAKKTELDRQVQREKTGVKVEGIELVNPLTNQKVPLFVADYVLAGYGTGAIMAVPAHDERDYQFAQKYALPIVPVTESKDADFVSYQDIKENRTEYRLKSSGAFDGMNFAEGREAILAELIAKKAGKESSQYKLRDWLISRQRYWGAPIPVVYDPEGNPHPVKEEHLPWELPTDVDFKPTGESPLVSSKAFIERTEKLYGKGWRPEFDTMDTFVDSSWYFMRYPDARNTEAFATPGMLQKWLPVDLYMIGPEHIVLHLLYSRFFTKALRDAGFLNFDEPFMKMRHQGMILGPDHKKMSKSKGNVINPDDVIEKFGADTLRVYEMFMGPIESDKPWDTSAVAGVYRFLTRIYRLVAEVLPENPSAKTDPQIERKLHQTIKKVSDDLPKLKFNTAIAALMELLNTIESVQKTALTQKTEFMSTESAVLLVKTIAPLAPFLAEELYQVLQGTSKPSAKDSVHKATWPVWDEQLAVEDLLIIPVQINGKVRAQLELNAAVAADKNEVLSLAKTNDKVQQWLDGKPVIKEIYVPGKIVNLVV